MEQLWSLDLFVSLQLKFNLFMQTLSNYLSGTNNLKIISFLLMALALILFLALIIIVFVRNMVDFIKNDNPQKKIRLADAPYNYNKSSEDEQLELERELQKELDMALAERKEIEEQEELQKAQQHQKEIVKEEKEKTIDEASNNLNRKHLSKIKVALDWQKGKIPSAEQSSMQNLNNVSLTYQQSCKKLNQLIGILIDMLGRGVDDLKIAQTLNFKTFGTTDENEIIKTIDAVKKFIELCLSGRFAKLPDYNTLPNEEQAMYHLAQGDPSLALSLMEKLMDVSIDKANAVVSEEIRYNIYNEVSSWACSFGALAELNDVMLATSAYELAVELQSTNVTAWSYLGDAYIRTNLDSKAVWAYQNVLDFANDDIDIAQIANANKHLSEQLYAQGDSLQAAKLYNSAKVYYDSIGINRRLDKQELEIIEIIDSNQQTSLPEMIKKLIGKSNDQA